MANLCFTQFAIFGDKNSLEEFEKYGVAKKI